MSLIGGKGKGGSSTESFDGWDRSKAYKAGAISSYIGIKAVANCDVPAGCEFSFGLKSQSDAVITITGVSKEGDAVLTCTGQPENINEYTIYISGVQGMTQLNGAHIVKSRTATTVTLYTDSSAFSTYTSGGTAKLITWSPAVADGRAWKGPYNDSTQYVKGDLVTGWARARLFLAVRDSTTAGVHNNPYSGENRVMWRELQNENLYLNRSGIDFTQGNEAFTPYRDMLLVSHGNGGSAKNIIGRHIPWIVANQDEADRLCAYFLQRLAVFLKNFDNDVHTDPLVSGIVNNSGITNQMAIGTMPCVSGLGNSDMDNQRIINATSPNWDGISEWYELLVARTKDENPKFYTM